MSVPEGWGSRQAALAADDLKFKVDRRAVHTPGGDDDLDDDERRNIETRRLYEKNDGQGGASFVSLSSTGSTGPSIPGWGNRHTLDQAKAAIPTDTKVKEQPERVASPFGGSGRHALHAGALAPSTVSTNATAVRSVNNMNDTHSNANEQKCALVLPANGTSAAIDRAVYTFALQHVEKEVGDLHKEMMDINMQMSKLEKRKQEVILGWQKKAGELQALKKRKAQFDSDISQPMAT